MSPATAWLAGYAGLVVLAALTVLLRREPSLLRGRPAFTFTLAYLAAAWAHLAWRDVVPPVLVVGAAAVALAATAAAAPWWFVIGGPRAAVVSTLEVCLGRVCAVYERTPAGFVMAVPAGGLHIGVHALPFTRVTVVSLRPRPPHRKGDLLGRLFVKQYRGVLPTLRIRIGGA